MTTKVVIKDNIRQAVGELKKLADLAKDYAKLSRAENTTKAYLSDWKDFENWCRSKQLISLPAIPQTVAVYLADRATNAWNDSSGNLQSPLKISSLQRRLTSICQMHLLAQAPFDRRHRDVQEVWKGIRNKNGVAQTRKEPILIEDIREMVSSLIECDKGESSIRGIRDRALLLMGFVGAFRRSELVSIGLEDIKFVKEGMLVHLRKSKTDQEGKGRELAIPYGSHPFTCPVRTLRDWIDVSGITRGSLFRAINRHGHISERALSSHSVALIIKRNQYIAGRKEKFSGHSLRAGFATTAAMAGVSEHLIMRQTGHKRSDTIKKYIRLGNVWKENAAMKIGL